MLTRGQFSPQITVEDIVKLALPPGTRVVAGETGLGREVTWAVAQRTRLPVFPSLKGGEIALVSIETLRLTHDGVTFPQLMRQLADIGIAAIGIIGEVPQVAEELANDLSIPLLALPSDSNPRDLESQISRTITELRTEMYSWDLELHRRFTRISVQGEGVQAIVEALNEITGQAAVFEDKHNSRRIVSSGFNKLELPNDSLGGNAIAPVATKEWTRTLDPESFDSPVKKFPLHGTNLAQLITPVVVRQRVVGHLSLLGPPESLDELRRHALLSAASACAMDMARRLAVLDVENRFRGEFVDTLVEGSFLSIDEISSRGKIIGFDPNRPYIVAIASLDPVQQSKLPPNARKKTSTLDRRSGFVTAFQDELTRLVSDCLVRAREDVAIALCPIAADDATAIATIESVIDTARRQAVRKMGGLKASVGIGRHHPGIKGVATSYQEAQQALAIGQSLLGGQSSTYFGNLGIYRLLFLLRESPDLVDFYQETLGQLAEYDHKNRSNLIQTLETYFACHGNVERTAESLFLHRNTLAYRLRRIQQLTGLDLKNMEDVFRFQFALKIRRVVQPPLH